MFVGAVVAAVARLVVGFVAGLICRAAVRVSNSPPDRLRRSWSRAERSTTQRPWDTLDLPSHETAVELPEALLKEIAREIG